MHAHSLEPWTHGHVFLGDDPRPPAHYKARLAGMAGLSHVTVEVQPCPGHHAPAGCRESAAV